MQKENKVELGGRFSKNLNTATGDKISESYP